MEKLETLKVRTAIQNFKNSYKELALAFKDSEQGLDLALNSNDKALDIYSEIFNDSFDDLKINELCDAMLEQL